MGKVRETESVGIRMEQRAFSRTAEIDTHAACTHNPHEHRRGPRNKVCVDLCMGEPPPLQSVFLCVFEVVRASVFVCIAVCRAVQKTKRQKREGSELASKEPKC